MASGDQDRLVRLAAFTFLRDLVDRQGEVLPAGPLREGFLFQDHRVPLQGPQGIFKPAVVDLPLSITTAPVVAGHDRPYEDELGPDGFLRYRYRGTDPHHRDNVGLRAAMAERAPLVYLHGIAKGQYLAQWPVFIVGDDPASLTFTVAVDDPLAVDVEPTGDVTDEARRAYVTRLARQRLHQLAFRHRVLRAYRESCTMCRLRHPELLDAAHILPDTHPEGEPVTSNGLALCKLHHAAFDRNVVGVRPDLIVEVRRDILDEIDGPMLRYGLQELHGSRLSIVPRREADRPNAEFLDERYQIFRAAG
ncbi:MAG TPA: HNH endonuclease [Acidimicrobiales bacterium]|nr:HNH endonuclease [Acidimicrobiales bacterium]